MFRTTVGYVSVYRLRVSPTNHVSTSDILCPHDVAKTACYVRDSDLHVIERSLWRAGHMSGLHLQLDETRVSSYFQSIKPAHSAHARTCSLQRSITALLASKKSER